MLMLDHDFQQADIAEKKFIPRIAQGSQRGGRKFFGAGKIPECNARIQQIAVHLRLGVEALHDSWVGRVEVLWHLHDRCRKPERAESIVIDNQRTDFRKWLVAITEDDTLALPNQARIFG